MLHVPYLKGLSVLKRFLVISSGSSGFLPQIPVKEHQTEGQKAYVRYLKWNMVNKPENCRSVLRYSRTSVHFLNNQKVEKSSDLIATP